MGHCNFKVQGHVIQLWNKNTHFFIIVKCCTKPNIRRSQWPRGLRRRSAAVRLLRLWVRIPPGAWIAVCCDCCVLSGRGLCDGLITRPEESYRMCGVSECDHESSIMRRSWPTGGCWSWQKKKLIYTYSPIWIRPIHQCLASYALMVIVSTPPTPNEKCGTTSLPNPSRLPKEHWFLEDSQVSLICPSGESRVWMEISMEDGWNDTHTDKLKHSDKTFLQYQSLGHTSHRNRPGIEHGPVGWEADD